MYSRCSLPDSVVIDVWNHDAVDVKKQSELLYVRYKVRNVSSFTLLDFCKHCMTSLLPLVVCYLQIQISRPNTSYNISLPLEIN